jgi:hypothetical protein
MHAVHEATFKVLSQTPLTSWTRWTSWTQTVDIPFQGFQSDFVRASSSSSRQEESGCIEHTWNTNNWLVLFNPPQNSASFTRLCRLRHARPFTPPWFMSPCFAGHHREDPNTVLNCIELSYPTIKFQIIVHPERMVGGNLLCKPGLKKAPATLLIFLSCSAQPRGSTISLLASGSPQWMSRN